jgi:hypothetical protein
VAVALPPDAMFGTAKCDVSGCLTTPMSDSRSISTPISMMLDPRQASMAFLS